MPQFLKADPYTPCNIIIIITTTIIIITIIIFIIALFIFQLICHPKRFSENVKDPQMI